MTFANTKISKIESHKISYINNNREIDDEIDLWHICIDRLIYTN